MKPYASLESVLSASASILFDDESSANIIAELQRKETHLPSLSLLRVGRQRLDMLSVLFEQHVFLRSDTLFYLLIDASPQLGTNFFCVIEDSFRVLAAHSIDAWLHVVMHLNDHYEGGHELLSSLGHGRAGLVKKSTNTIN